MAVDIVQEIKLRTDLVELISTYVPLKQSGRTHKGLCPFHAEKTPSFTVDGERGFFKCYGCGAGGDCFSFLQTKEGLSFPEAGEVLARRLGLEWQRRGDTAETRSERERLHDVNELAQRFFRQRLQEAPAVRAYLERRGLLPETVEQFGLGYAPPGYEALLAWLKREKVSLEDAAAADVILQGEHGWRDRFVDRLMFPIFDLEGRVIAFGGRTLKPDGVPKYLNSRETAVFHKGRTLYGLHLAKRAIPEAGFSVAVEGYMDVIALHQAGLANSVASLGTAITEGHVAILGRYSKQLVMCYDGDSAGIRAAERNSAMFEKADCEVRVAVLPEGDDPDTYIKTHGADAFRTLLNRAEPLLDYQLNRLRAGYNLSDETTRLPFVREAARIIAQSGSSLTQQEYKSRLTRVLDRLAEEWYPGDPHRVMQARVALNDELTRLLRTRRIDGRGDGPAPPVRAPRAAPSGRTRAERYVLRAALTEYRWAELVASRLTPAQFRDPAISGVAGALLGDNGGSGPVAERVDALRGDPANAEIMSELLMDETPLCDEILEKGLVRLEQEQKQDRLRELTRAYEAGEFAPDDPRREELLRLSSEPGARQRRED
ncbi:MAG TPA: DNA primase [Armatimonadota bacterium]|nr:DNA primase [Armatimonadota bacterium]